MSAFVVKTITPHGTIVRVMESRFGGFYWQSHRDFLGTGETTRTSLIASGTAETVEAATEAAFDITEGYKPPMVEPLVTFY